LDAYNLINPDVQSYFSSYEFFESVVANVRIMPLSSDTRIVIENQNSCHLLCHQVLPASFVLQ